MPNLDETNPSFHEAPGDEDLSCLGSLTVQFPDMLRFAADIEGIRSVHLHAVRQFETLDSSFELGIDGSSLAMSFVKLLEEIQLSPLFCGGLEAVGNILDEFLDGGVLGVDVRALVDTGKESTLPVLRLLNGISPGAHGDEPGHILVFTAQTVGHPRSERGAHLSGFSAVHEQQGRLVIRNIRLHGANHTQIVGIGCGFFEQFTDLKPALAVFAEPEWRTECGPSLSFRGEVDGDRFAVIGIE